MPAGNSPYKLLINGTEIKGKAKKMRKEIKPNKKVKWSCVFRVEDISPRKTRDWTYVILETDLGVKVCCSENLAQALCCFEPYEMKGYLNFSRGSTYLVLERANLLHGGEYIKTDKF